jgi:hypothetical protein
MMTGNYTLELVHLDKSPTIGQARRLTVLCKDKLGNMNFWDQVPTITLTQCTEAGFAGYIIARRAHLEPFGVPMVKLYAKKTDA